MNKEDLNFLAIDFETATASRQACQLGIVVVKHGSIIEERSWLIQPDGNKYEESTVQVHGILPSDTLYCKKFPEVWKEAEPYFLDTKLVVAHNAPFDSDVLQRNLDFYSIKSKIRVEFRCTYEMYGKNLHELCVQFGINPDGHHDALFDAQCCAKFYMAHEIGEETVFSKPKTLYHERIGGDLLKKDLTDADPNNPFYDKKVVITGVFNVDRKLIAALLKKCGADIDGGITKRTNIVVIGDEAGPKKMEKLNQLIADGHEIEIYSKERIEKFYEENINI